MGVVIESRPRSTVVAPMSGKILYANKFKNYGKLIIIEHKDGYHSLVAGLGKIDTVVGQVVIAGEPLGTLSVTSTQGGRPTLYYELRKNGKSVNPSKKLIGLKS